MNYNILNYFTYNSYSNDYNNDNIINNTDKDYIDDGNISMFNQTILWGLTIVTFTYCSVLLVNTCKNVISDNNRDRVITSDMRNSLINNQNTDPILVTHIQYSDDEILDTCSICLYGYKVDEKLVKLNCNHIYHGECIFDWFKKNRNCPLCRMSV